MTLSLTVLTTLAAACAPPQSPVTAGTPKIEDVRVSQFSESRQDGVGLALQPDGTLVEVWHSRRQEEGSYGVRARRISADGQPLGDEVQVNAATRGMQLWPTVSSDLAGATWVAWVSRGQDGHGDGVYARRFSPDLTRATAEVRVDTEVEGDQSTPSIVALEDGRALCVWTGPAADRSEEPAASRVGVALYARFLAASGEPVGAPLRLDVGTTEADVAALAHIAGARTPAAARWKDGAAVVFGAHDAAGVPNSVILREVGADGALGAPVVVTGNANGAPIEPVVAAHGERLAVAWLTARGDGDHDVRWRDVAAERPGKERLERGHTVAAPGTGYTSGLAVDVRGEHTALAFGRYLADQHHAPDLFIALSNEDEVSVRPATLRREGPQAIDVGGAARRLLFTPGGGLALAWQGDANLGDSSAAHVSLVAPTGAAPGEAHHAPVAIADAEALRPLDDPARASTRGAATTGDTGEAAAPHDPPTFDRRNAESNAPVAAPDGVGGDIDFLGFSNTGWTPPDPEMAIGMDHLVAIVNGGIKYFDKAGTQLFFNQIEGPGGFWGSVGATSFVFDPEVLWDPHTNRFVALAAERSGSLSHFLLAVSDDGNPMGSWYKYRLNVTAFIGSDIDSVNLSIDEDAIYLTGDWFSPTRYFIYAIDKASILNGGATPVARTLTINGRHSMGAPVNYDAGAPAAYFVHAPESSSPSQIRVYAVSDPLGTPSAQFADVAVPTYTPPGAPPQQGTSTRPELFEARFWSAVIRNGSLWATHHQGTPVRQRWYEVDLRGWPASGQTPTLVQSGQVEAPGGGATYFGSLWVNDLGQMALTCATSSPSAFISMARTGRSPLDPPGFTPPVTTVITSTAPDTSGRWGDYSATNDDPADPGRFWGHHEYRLSSWRTRIASFEMCAGAVESYCTTSPNSVGAGAQITASGSTSLTANDLVLASQGASGGAFGVFFFGDARTSASVGDGVLCVTGNLFRLGVTQADTLGLSSLAVDTSSPPASTIAAGSTWNFQFFYRDIQPGGAGLNFSDAIEVRFCN